jgi:hypothetical protein
MQCAVYLCRHKRAGAWTLVLPVVDPVPQNWPGVTILCVGSFETEFGAAEVARELMAAAAPSMNGSTRLQRSR